MTSAISKDGFGQLSSDHTLTIERMLPGPIERVWAYLTESELRRQWLADGAMELKAGAAFTFRWRNDQLSDPPGPLPPGYSNDHSMKSHITEIDPPRKISFTWDGTGDVTFELEPRGHRVLLTVTHRRIADRNVRLNVGPGWHNHLDVLATKLSGGAPEPFWENFVHLRKEYERRFG